MPFQESQEKFIILMKKNVLSVALVLVFAHFMLLAKINEELITYLKRRENQEGYAGVLYMMGGMWTLDLI